MANKNNDRKKPGKEEDSLLRLIMNDAAEKEGESFREENEWLKKDPANQPSPEKIKKFSHRLDSHMKRRNVSHILRKAAVVVLVSAAVFSAAMVTGDAFRAQVMNLLSGFQSTTASSSPAVSLTPSRPGGNSEAAGGVSTAPGSQSGNSSQTDTPQQSVLNQIHAVLNTKVPLMLPTSVPVGNGRSLTAATVSQMTTYKVSFYETNQPAKINSPAASQGTLIATVEGTEYQDAASAKDSIPGYVQIDTSQYDEFLDLGHNIKAVEDAGAGHQQLKWNEGRWYIDVDSPTDPAFQNKEYPDREQLAKNVVAYLDGHMLPAPQKIGVIRIDIWNQNYGATITWQENQTVYQVSGKDPMTALKVAVAMK